MNYSLLVSKQCIIMFLMSCVGIICYKTNIITQKTQKAFSGFIINIVAPIFLFMSFQIELSKELIANIITSLVLGILSHIILIILSWVFVRKKDNKNYSIERFSLSYTNCGFMGIPLILAVLGQEGALYATMYVAIFNFLTWSHGVAIMKNEFTKKEILNIIKSPAIIAIFLGIICLLVGFRLPTIIASPLEYIASMNTPLPMLIAGVTIAQNNIISTLKDKRAIYISFLRLFLLPIIVMLLLLIIPSDNVVFMSIILLVSCPSAAICTILAVEYNKDAAYSSRIFAITTIFSSISMPIIIAIMNLLV